jgi:MFS transporter, LAT3 family, solute carrier family 43, member 3
MKLHRLYYLITAIFQIFVVAGSFFGWNSMQPILFSEGFLNFKCPPTTDSSKFCDSAAVDFSNIYTATSTVSFVAPLFSGIVLDAYGPKITLIGCMTIFAIGPILLIVATSAGISSLAIYYLAFICFGLAASSQMGPFMSVSLLFPQSQGLVVAILNGSFDAATIVFLIMYYLHFNVGMSLTSIMIAFLCGPVLLCWLNMVFIWPLNGFASPTPIVHSTTPINEASSITESQGIDKQDQDIEVANPMTVVIPRQQLAVTPVPDTFWEQLSSRGFTLFLIFHAIQMVRFSFYIGTAITQLSLMNDPGKYANIFSIILPVGFFVQFLVGHLLDNYGNCMTITVQYVLSIVFSVLNLIPNLPLQILTFLIFICYRAFIFSNMSSYLIRRFGFKTFGKLVGIAVAAGGLASLLQIPLVLWAVSSSFFVVNLLLLSLTVVAGLFPLWLYLVDKNFKLLGSKSQREA